jgi:hypothetical protein
MGDPRQMAYMAAGGLAIFFGFQYAGLCLVAIGKLTHIF